MSGARLQIKRLELLLAKARREQYGRSSESGAKLVAQLELQLAELEETVAEDETAAELAVEAAATNTGTVIGEHVRRNRPAGRSRSICRANDAWSRRPRVAAAAAAAAWPKSARPSPRRSMSSAPLVREADRAREVHVPGLRDDHRATGALPCYCPRARRSQPACDDSVRVWHPSAAQPAERALCSRRRRDRRVDHGRSRRRQRRRTDAALRAHPQSRARRRALARRRHHRAGVGQEQDRDRPTVGLCSRRPALRPGQGRPAGGALPLFPRSPRQAS